MELSRCCRWIYSIVEDEMLFDRDWSIFRDVKSGVVEPFGEESWILQGLSGTSIDFKMVGGTFRVALMPTNCTFCSRLRSFVAINSNKNPRPSSPIMCSSSITTRPILPTERSSMTTLTRAFAYPVAKQMQGWIKAAIPFQSCRLQYRFLSSSP